MAVIHMHDDPSYTLLPGVTIGGNLVTGTDKAFTLGITGAVTKWFVNPFSSRAFAFATSQGQAVPASSFILGAFVTPGNGNADPTDYFVVGEWTNGYKNLEFNAPLIGFMPGSDIGGTTVLYFAGL